MKPKFTTDSTSIRFIKLAHCLALEDVCMRILYIGIAHADDVRYRQTTHISSSSNARWGSLRLAPTIG